jgi:hypothetical protein
MDLSQFLRDSAKFRTHLKEISFRHPRIERFLTHSGISLELQQNPAVAFDSELMITRTSYGL